ncbi:MAG TPA: TOMM precursor leader peptide-binding protein [Streptosporangiaceae bacterium]|nr:TOMM precursor leader peptide-binding protein [Streptosporangiaceae bacterium]
MLADPQWRPRLRDSIIVQRDGDELLFLFSANRTVKRFAVNEVALRLLPLLDGTRTLTDLYELASPEELRPILDVLREERILSGTSDIAADAADALGSVQADHYDRQLRLFQDFCDEGLSDLPGGVDLQRALGAATIAVCGAGGLGSWVLHSLAAAGTGTIRVCDFDRVEPSNLTRQVLFAATDVGRPKTEAAAERLRTINPHIAVEPIERKITCPDDLEDVVAGVDLLVNCADQPDPIALATVVSAACQPTVPHIMGASYAYHVGILGTTIIPGKTACWECVRTETLADHGRDRAVTYISRRERAGVAGPLSGMVGNLLAWEAIRVLTGLPPALSDRWVEFDYWPLRVQERPVPRRPGCPVCG